MGARDGKNMIRSFYGRDFEYSKDVYISTHETEMLISYVLKHFNNPKMILDVGTGSGALGITLAKELPKSRIIGLDISEKALSIAKINAKRNGAGNFSVIWSDYVRSIVDEPDLIIADLPWGSREYLLKSNKDIDLDSVPENTFFPSDGNPMGCYADLCKQIIDKNWNTKAIIETGNMPEQLVRDYIPKNIGLEYLVLNPEYSITKITFDGKQKIVGPEGHFHLLYYAQIPYNIAKKVDDKDTLETFLYKTLKVSDMHCLIPPILKRSNRDAWTGLMGIITSHISFHLWTNNYGPNNNPGVQFDIYSCKPFDTNIMIDFLNGFFQPSRYDYKTINREHKF